jgi:hypothetical protein
MKIFIYNYRNEFKELNPDNVKNMSLIWQLNKVREIVYYDEDRNQLGFHELPEKLRTALTVSEVKS